MQHLARLWLPCLILLQVDHTAVITNMVAVDTTLPNNVFPDACFLFFSKSRASLGFHHPAGQVQKKSGGISLGSAASTYWDTVAPNYRRMLGLEPPNVIWNVILQLDLSIHGVHLVISPTPALWAPLYCGIHYFSSEFWSCHWLNKVGVGVNRININCCPHASFQSREWNFWVSFASVVKEPVIPSIHNERIQGRVKPCLCKKKKNPATFSRQIISLYW